MTETQEKQPPQFRYLGQGKAHGSIHTIVRRTKNEVITWSLYDQNPNDDGFSWVGTPGEFSFEFERIK